MSPLNLIDILSLIPYYVEMFLIYKSYSKVVVSSLRILRIARIFNLLKLYRLEIINIFYSYSEIEYLMSCLLLQVLFFKPSSLS